MFYLHFTVHGSFPRNILNDGKVDAVGVFKDFISALIYLLLTLNDIDPHLIEKWVHPLRISPVEY